MFRKHKMPSSSECHRICELYLRLGQNIGGKCLEYDARSGRLLLQTEYLDLIEKLVDRVEILETGLKDLTSQ